MVDWSKENIALVLLGPRKRSLNKRSLRKNHEPKNKLSTQKQTRKKSSLATAIVLIAALDPWVPRGACWPLGFLHQCQCKVKKFPLNVREPFKNVLADCVR